MKILIREIDERLKGQERRQAEQAAAQGMLRDVLRLAGRLTAADGSRIGGDDMASRESQEAIEAAADAPLPEIAVSEQGKPYLPAMPDFHYNVSHSGRFVVLAASYPDDHAITPQAPAEVGIDIQRMVPVREGVDAMAARYYTAEEAEFLAALAEDTPEHQEMKRSLFYQLWAIKEAYGKCLGCGIAGGLSSFTIEPSTAYKDAGLVRDKESGAALARYLLLSPPDPEYVMAVCTRI